MEYPCSAQARVHIVVCVDSPVSSYFPSTRHRRFRRLAAIRVTVCRCASLRTESFETDCSRRDPVNAFVRRERATCPPRARHRSSLIVAISGARKTTRAVLGRVTGKTPASSSGRGENEKRTFLWGTAKFVHTHTSLCGSHL